MKKILALVLALMLVLSTSMVAFAAGEGDNDGSVYVVIETGDDEWTGDPNDVDSGATYEIDIDLIDVTFTYNFGDYSTDTHEYDGDGWDKDDADITIKNHSNTSLDVTPKFTDGDTNTAKTTDGVTATITTAGPIRIASAVGKTRDDNGNNDETPTGTVNVAISGTPEVESGWKLATLRLTIDGTSAN